jgi:pimeloyl-ACP methyl ester carboxylesterase
MVDKLKQYTVLEDESYVKLFFKSMIRDQAMHELGIGTMRNMKSLEIGIALPIMLCKAYTVKEKFNIWKSKISFIRKTVLADQVLSTDLTTEITELEVPICFFSGIYDLTVNHDLSKAYLSKLSAPEKAFYTFENSAHSPIFEEPEKVVDIIKTDILRGTQ